MLAEYDITIIHRLGVTHQDADALSRLVDSKLSSDDYTGARLDGACSRADEDAAAEPLVANVLARWDPIAPSTSPIRIAWEHFLASCVPEGGTRPQLSSPHPSHPGRYEGVAGRFGERPTLGLCTKTLHPTFFPLAAVEGLTLYEPFRGMCSGPNMLLSCCVKIRRYLYSDIGPVAQRIAKCRVTHLPY